MDETLLTVTQVAEKLQMHAVTIRRMLRDGTIKGIKLGAKDWRIPLSALNLFIEGKMGAH